MPAEWEPHAATWLAWPCSADWPGKLEAVRWVFTEVIRLLTPRERVRLIVPAGEQQAVTAWLQRAHVDIGQVDLFVATTDRTWTRDSLPLFVVDEGRRRVGAVKWRFNGWARYDDHELDERAGRAVAERYLPHWFPSVEVDGKPWHVVLEGGSVDLDGEGTLLTTRRCLLGAPYQRNPGLDQGQVERVLAEYLGARHVIWLEDGVAGDDTSGHVDDFARFVAPGCVVVSQESDRQDPNFEPLWQARQVLEHSHDARGRKLQVVPLPMPQPLWLDGERLPASYANFYIANDIVLVPTFNDPNDRVALGILQELMPGRIVRGVHAVDLVLGLGTLHCSTQQEPRVG